MVTVDEMDQAVNVKRKINNILSLCVKEGVSQEIIDQLKTIAEIYSENDMRDAAECSAQFSLYPLRTLTITPTIQVALSEIENYDLRVSPGPMSTLLYGNEDNLWHALKNVFTKASIQGDIVMVLTVSNACPVDD